MDWCRLSTRYYFDGALLRAGESAEVLFLRCIAYSGLEETKGIVPRHVLPMLCPSKTAQRITALVRENLLVPVGDDYRIRSWEKHQEALDSESERREKDRLRKAAERAAVRGQCVDTSRSLSQDTSTDSPRTVHPESARIEVEVEKERTKEDAATPLVAVEEPDRPDVEAICLYFSDALATNGVTARVTAKWRTEARLMLDRDNRDPELIRQVIDWTVTDLFWRANILSIPKLREKFDRLRLAMESKTVSAPVPEWKRLGRFGDWDV